MDYLLLLISAATMYFGEKFKDYNPLRLPRYILEGIPGKHRTSEQAGKKRRSSETHLGFAMLTCKTG